MKIKAKKDAIESILINLQPFLEKKDATQITSHIYIEAKNNEVIFRATDYEVGLEIKSPYFQIVQEGKATANGKRLLDIIRILKNKEITLNSDENFLKISQEHSNFKLPTFNPNEYPQFPTKEDKEKITLNSQELIKNLKKITPAIDTNNPKYELNGALIDIKSQKSALVGTDTKRLAIAYIANKSERELSLIVPKKAIMEIQKLFFDEIEINYDENSLIVTNDNYFFYTRLINGKFPDYERIIPKSLKYEIKLPKKEMIDSIKMIAALSSDIKITFEATKIIFESLSSDNIEAKTSIDYETSINNPFTLAVNSKHILDFLTHIDSNSFTIGLNEPNLPFLLKEENFLTIIMPIIL